ncbi:MAG: RNA-binding S4 domain-containing protein [Tsuneonella sp.]
MRIDKLLWQLRLTKTRSQAQALVLAGHIRRNGGRVVRTSQDIATGDTLTLPLPSGVRVIEVLALPVRRGPPVEAQACYRALDPQAFPAIAATGNETPERGQPQ